MKDETHAEFRIDGGMLQSDSGFVGGEISPGDEIITGRIDASSPLFGSKYNDVPGMIVMDADIVRPCLPGINKGDKITLNLWGEEEDYLVVSIDEHGMTLEDI